MLFLILARLHLASSRGSCACDFICYVSILQSKQEAQLPQRWRASAVSTPFKVIQGDRFSYQSRARVRLPDSEVADILSRLPVIAQSLLRRCLSVTNSFSETSEHIAMNHILPKLDSLDYVSVAGSMGLTLTNLT